MPVALLWRQGLPCALLDPCQVRRFAEGTGVEGMGVLEKTDRIDAGLIAWFAEVRCIVPQAPASEGQAKLEALVTRLRQLTELRTAQTNQRRLVTDPDARPSIAAIVALANRQMRDLSAKIAALIDADPLWSRLDEAFRSLKDVADHTVARLMVQMPEVGTLSGKAVAKLAGLAPIARDSGQDSGRRSIRGGRAGIRSLLFVVAEIVRRHEPDFARAHARLTAAGKPPKVVRVALARKLLVRLNAEARDVRKTLQTA